MKKSTLLTLLLGLFSLGFSQPKITETAFPNSVNIFGLYEISFLLGTYSNPYDPEVIDVYGEFVGPDGKSLKVNGFYFEEYTFQQQQGYEVATAGKANGWRIRFTPDQIGTWSFSIHAIDSNGETTLSSFESERFGFICESADATYGFVSVANKRFLKREVFENGQRKNRSFFPVGPNVAWYEYKGSPSYPKGIYDYEKYIDSLWGSANYMRIWLNRYQYLSLYGPEYAQTDGKKPTVFFDSTLNQKDAAELDHIVDYATKHDITLMPCIFTFGDFFNEHNSSSKWDNNPFHTVLRLSSSNRFFTDREAKRITKNLIRYIVARWGYATNIACWELWNEVDNIPNGDRTAEQFQRDIVSWHNEMADYLRSVDPFKHLISTSTVHFSNNNYLSSNVFKSLDIVQRHTYGNIQKAKSKEQRSHELYDYTLVSQELYPDKPFFVGEFGFGQSEKNPKYQDKDPYGFDTHNCLWSSMFSSAAGPASFWFWNYLTQQDLLRIYEPMLKFSNQLPLLSDSFNARSTASVTKCSTIFPNGIETYYMINAAEDTLYGWCQDSAFSYQALRRLTDREGKNGHFDDNGVFDPKGYVYTLDQAKKPRPCSKSNTISLPIDNQPVGTRYIVRWFDAETGLEMATEKTVAMVQRRIFRGKFISFEFPSSVRDVKQGKINNTFGDAVFSIIKANGTKEGSNADDAAPKKSKTIKVTRPNGTNQ